MEIEIMNVDNVEDFEKVDSVLRSLIESTEGTYPGSRNFGLTGDAVNENPEAAVNTLFYELDEKLPQFLPEINIEDIEIVGYGEGVTTLRIYVTQNEEEDEDDQGD